MARETKVGLLAGLAFIICFAIILANRGRLDPVGSSPVTKMDRSVSTPNIGQGIPIQAPGHSAPRRSPAAEVPRGPKTAGAKMDPVRMRASKVADQRVADSGEGIPATDPRLASRREQIPLIVEHESSQVASPAGAGGLQRVTTPAGNPGMITPTAEQLHRQAILQQRLDAMSNGYDRAEEAPRPVVRSAAEEHRTAHRPVETPRPKPLKPRRTYRVKPGDTLTRIAALHYDRSTSAVINAIYEANRSKMPSPDSLRVDAELVLPEIEDSTPRSAVERGERSTSIGSSQSQSPAESEIRWYQIKKNDRYVSIARDQLGDGKRWREIYELNKDKFPDPQRIRHGVRIKLPATNSSTGGR